MRPAFGAHLAGIANRSLGVTPVIQRIADDELAQGNAAGVPGGAIVTVGPGQAVLEMCHQRPDVVTVSGVDQRIGAGLVAFLRARLLDFERMKEFLLAQERLHVGYRGGAAQVAHVDVADALNR